MTGPIFEVLAAVEASRRLVPTDIIARIGTEHFVLGTAEVSEGDPARQVATLLRGVADELEREAP